MRAAVTTGLLAFGPALASAPAVLWVLHRLEVLDHPNERSSHAVPTPRGGGLALAVGVMSALTLGPPLGGPLKGGMLVATAGFGVLGLAEDLRGVPVLPRLALQGLVAAAALPWLLDDLTGPPAWRLVFCAACLVWLVAYVNGFNFMDGINGIAAAQAVVAGGAWWAIGQAQDVSPLARGGAVAVGAALAFVPFNYPRARMFLGDAGSYLLGAWLAVLAVVGLRAGLPPEAVLAPVAVYLADTGSTLVRRIVAGEVWYRPHRTHVYQRLVEAGWSHTRTTAVVTGTMAACSALGAVSLSGSLALRITAGAALASVLAAYIAAPTVFAPARPLPINLSAPAAGADHPAPAAVTS